MFRVLETIFVIFVGDLQIVEHENRRLSTTVSYYGNQQEIFPVLGELMQLFKAKSKWSDAGQWWEN